MRMIGIAAIVVLSAGTAAADCASMWVTRNMVFDRAGYCFGSTLGQALFDNADCTPGDVELTLAERDFVAHTRAMEAEFQCNIDTGRSTLDIENLNAWMRLKDLPYRDIGESGCIGWQGARTALHVAASEQSPVIGQIMRGDTLIFAHGDIGDFSFVQVRRGARQTDLGWVRLSLDEAACEMFAG